MLASQSPTNLSIPVLTLVPAWLCRPGPSTKQAGIISTKQAGIILTIKARISLAKHAEAD